MSSRKYRVLIFCLLVILISLPLSGSYATAPPESGDLCLGCHSSESMSLPLKNGEQLSLYVDGGGLQKSVHKVLDCPSCHSGFSAENHPSTIRESKRAYAVAGSALCKNCHVSFKSELHARMTSKAKERGKLCVDCHGSHEIEPVAKAAISDSDYCLGCHGNEMTMSFRDGSEMSLHVDISALKVSVHSKLYCSDCHFGFSPEDHPVRTFKNRRDYSFGASESCRRCHFDKYTKTLESIHYAMLSQGNMKAPVCTDCHGAHSIAQTGKERTQNAKRCEQCHGEIYRTYAQSVHGSALFHDNNQDVPVCSDCHRAHNIEDPRTFDYREKIPHMCGNCHADEDLMDKYGLTTAVLNSYLQDFHGITLELYKRQRNSGDVSGIKPIAVCIDCHGIHDITPTTGPNSSIVKANLVRRCQKCHPDASENFPDSWISHYKPSLKKAPLVFIINVVYKIFIPFMMVGLILQILLHIWRYTVNR